MRFLLFPVFVARASVETGAVERQSWKLPNDGADSFRKLGLALNGERRESVWAAENFSLSYARINNRATVSSTENCVENYGGFAKENFDKTIARRIFNDMKYKPCAAPRKGGKKPSETITPSLSCGDKIWIRLDCAVQGNEAVTLTRMGNHPGTLGAFKSENSIIGFGKKVLGIKESMNTFQDRIRCEIDRQSEDHQLNECRQMWTQFQNIQARMNKAKVESEKGLGVVTQAGINKAEGTAGSEGAQTVDSSDDAATSTEAVHADSDEERQKSTSPNAAKATSGEVANAPTEPEKAEPKAEGGMDTTTILLITGGVLAFILIVVGLMKVMNGTNDKPNRGQEEEALSSSSMHDEEEPDDKTPLKHHRKKSSKV